MEEFGKMFGAGLLISSVIAEECPMSAWDRMSK